MKKYSILSIAICCLSLLSCQTENKKADLNEGDVAKPIYILSIPNWAMSMSITDTLNQASKDPGVILDSLNVLQDFDNALFGSLKDNQFVRKFTIIKKLNPCCPCMSGGSGCCLCLAGDEGEGLSFASPTEMQASVMITDDSGTETTATKDPNADRVDLFTVPVGTRKVTINGRGMLRPLTFDFNN